MSALLRALARGALETIRETWPADERELGAFVAGLAYGLVLYVGMLIVVSWLTAKAFGWPL